MLDIKQIRKEAKTLEEKLKTKDSTVSLAPILALDEEIRAVKTEVEKLKSERNQISQEIGEKKRKKESADTLLQTMGAHGDTIQKLDKKLQELEPKFLHLMSCLPNIPLDEVKISQDPKENEIVKIHGEKRVFDFPFKNHLELNDRLDLFDFKRGAKIAGSGWPVYKNLGARLEWALLNYMMEIHRKNGFMQWIPPLCVRPEILFQSGQLPKFSGQQFHVKDEDFDLFLIPTAEVSLCGLHADEVIEARALPLRYFAYTPCFRREAGAAGKGERGLIRTHQFNKVEMFAFTKPEDSPALMEEMIGAAEEILEGLELHFRNARLVTGDMSFASMKTIDVEVFLPGQDRYYEVSSISNCGPFQSRRANIRYKSAEEKLDFVHTLNGSGLATSRLMVALLENHQEKDGSVKIPKALHRFFGQEKIVPIA